MFGSRMRDREVRAIQATAWGTWGDENPTGATWSGTNVTNQSALQLLAVYGCNRFICEGISTLPIDVYRERPDGEREPVAKPSWLTQPTVDLDVISWLTQILTSLLLAGNCYLRKVFDGQGRLVELVPLDPSKVTVRRDGGRKVFLINGTPIDAFEIVHIPGVMFPGSDIGLSPVEAARQSIGAGLAVEEFAARFFGQGANVGGVIEDPGPVDPEKAKLWAKTWARMHSGNRRAHMPGVLQGGAVWKPTAVTNEQAQFLETREFTGAEIASHMFLIDPTEFGFNGQKGSALTYANLEQRNARKIQVTFLPWMIRLEAAFSALLAAPRFMKFNANGLLRGDTKTRFETYELASLINTQSAAVGEPPLLTTAEMRQLEDMPPFEGPVPVPLPTPTVVTDAPGVGPGAPAAPVEAKSIEHPRRSRQLEVVRDNDGLITSLIPRDGQVVAIDEADSHAS